MISPNLTKESADSAFESFSATGDTQGLATCSTFSELNVGASRLTGKSHKNGHNKPLIYPAT